MELPLDDETLQRLYAWIDEIPLSRPKKSIARDFSDGILTAEVVAFYFPKLVQMHNYSPANSVKQKLYNWTTLNRKVLKKLHIFLAKDDIDDLVQCRPGAVEHLLVKLQLKASDALHSPRFAIASYSEKRPLSATSRRPIDNNADAYATPYNPSPSVGVASVVGTPGGGAASVRSQHLSPFDKVAEVREPLSQMKDLSLAAADAQASSDAQVAPSPHGFPSGFSAEHYAATSKAFGTSAESAASDARSEILERDTTIAEQRETIQILEMKVQKLEQLVRLKDGKIQTLVAKLRSQKPPS